jgi:hypothetical protein
MLYQGIDAVVVVACDFALLSFSLKRVQKVV